MIILEKVWECESVFKLTAYSSQLSKEYRLLKFCCMPTTSSTTSKAFSLFLLQPLTVLMKQTSQAPLSSLYYLNVNDYSPDLLYIFRSLVNTQPRFKTSLTPELTRKMAIRPTLMVSQGTVRAGSFLAAAKICRRGQ